MAKFHIPEILRKKCRESLSSFSDEGRAAEWSSKVDHKVAQINDPEVAGARQKVDRDIVLVDAGRGAF